MLFSGQSGLLGVNFVQVWLVQFPSNQKVVVWLFVFLFSCLSGRGPSAYFWLDVALGDVGLVQYLSGRIGGTLESSRSRCVENQILFLTSGDAFSLIISQSPWLQYMGSHVLLFPALRQSLQSYPIRPYGVYPCFLEVGLEVFIVGTVSCVFPGCDTWVGRSRYPWL